MLRRDKKKWWNHLCLWLVSMCHRVIGRKLLNLGGWTILVAAGLLGGRLVELFLGQRLAGSLPLLSSCCFFGHGFRSLFTLFLRARENIAQAGIERSHFFLSKGHEIMQHICSSNLNLWDEITSSLFDYLCPSKLPVQSIRTRWCIIIMFVCSLTSCLTVVNIDIDQNHLLWWSSPGSTTSEVWTCQLNPGQRGGGWCLH